VPDFSVELVADIPAWDRPRAPLADMVQTVERIAFRRGGHCNPEVVIAGTR
jgi:hypothetical protein